MTKQEILSGLLKISRELDKREKYQESNVVFKVAKKVAEDITEEKQLDESRRGNPSDAQNKQLDSARSGVSEDTHETRLESKRSKK